MTRVEFLVVICVAFFAAYLVVRYQTTGEIFQISWRKAAAKTNSNPEIIQPSAIRFVDATNTPDQTSETLEVKTNSVSTSFVKKPADVNPPSTIPGMKVDDPKKQKVRVPTNAVWFPNKPRKSPGVRIAFP